MNRFYLPVNNSKGVVMVVALLFISVIMMLGGGILTNSIIRRTMSENNARRIQSFYAADGMMTLLAQEIWDGNYKKYLSTFGGCDQCTTGIFQAESASCAGAVIATDHLGFHGSGFRDFMNSSGDYIEWTVYMQSSGQYNLGFRYSSSGSRPLQLKINGVIVDSSLNFPPTSDWDTWAFVYKLVNLNYGTNKIRLTAIGYSGGNFDELIITRGGSGSGTRKTGDFNVEWSLTEFKPNCFDITTGAYIDVSGKQRFKTPLKQYLETSAFAITNTYSDKVSVPVTFYDFHSDRTNPEFEQVHNPGIMKNMVGKHLDDMRKPVVGPSPMLNYYIKYWFRPWQTLAKNDGNIPLYQKTLHFEDCGTTDWVTSPIGAPNSAYGTMPADSAFRNVVIDTFLTFTHIGNGVYEFRDDSFYPLDNKGFFDNWNQATKCQGLPNVQHNYSFTLELHSTFIKQPGQKFIFKGDDDVWLFINNNLEMDLGGCHLPEQDTVFIDNLNLVDNEQYNIDFFYCERHSYGSSIWITTNLLSNIQIAENRRSWRRDYDLTR